jgi:hypothetical protein
MRKSNSVIEAGAPQVHDFQTHGVITQGEMVYTYEVVGSQQFAQPSVLPFYTRTRRLLPMKIGEFNIVPHGEQNNLPEEIRQILDDNNLTPEILNKQAQLLWGQGPALYEDVHTDGVRIRKWQPDTEIESWLRSWDYEDYLLKATVEFRHMNGHFTKYFRNRAPRIGGPGRIERLEHVSCVFARLEWPDKYKVIHGIIVGDFDQPWKYGLQRYQVYDPYDPFVKPVSMRYSNLYTFATVADYSRVPFNGSIGWIRLASSVAKLLSNFNANSAAIKYHIKIPAVYWADAEQELQDKCQKDNTVYDVKMLKDFKEKKLQAFADILRGVDNVGKFVATEKVFDDIANQYVDWTIDVLDQKVKDFIDAQVNISKQASLEVTSGLGLHPALSNISFDGNLPSGSEQLYAFKLYLLTGVAIPESIVCRDINNAISANFPEKRLKLGFYHDAVITESATAPADRIKNK